MYYLKRFLFLISLSLSSWASLCAQHFQHADSLASGYPFSFSAFSLSNIGSASPPIFYASSRLQNPDDFFVWNPFESWHLSHSSPKIPAAGVNTRLYFNSGSGRELNFRAKHLQRIKRKSGIYFGFNKIGADGFFAREKTKHSDILFGGEYSALSNRYVVSCLTQLSKYDVLESGGLLSQIDYLNASDISPVRHNVRFSDASFIRRDLIGSFKQRINLGPPVLSKNPVDSLLPPEFAHSFIILTEASRQQQCFSDGALLNGQYPSNLAIQPPVIKDSLSISSFRNGLFYEFKSLRPDSGNTPISQSALSVGATVNQFVVRQINMNDSVSSALNNVTVRSKFEHFFQRGLSIDLLGWMVASGFNEGEWKVNGLVRLAVDSVRNLNLSQTLAQLHPFFLDHYKSGSLVHWQNQFQLSTLSQTQLFYADDEHGQNIGMSYSLIEHPVFYDVSGLPNQSVGERGSLVRAHISQKLRWKWFNMSLMGLWQTASGVDVIRLPQYSLNSKLYYRGLVFKGKMDLNVGLEMDYFSGYKAQAYSPMLGQFYLQNDVVVGNYPYLHFNLGFNIASASVFFRVQHINYGLSGNNHFTTPDYPAQQRTFKIGLNWIFVD